MGRKFKFDYNYITIGLMYLLSFVFYKETFDVLNEGSRVFPRVISIASAFFATLLLIRILTSKKREEYNFEGIEKIAVITIYVILYIFMMKYIGFYIATPIFLIISFKYLKVDSKKVMIITPIVMDIAIFVFFDYLFKIPIPIGAFIEPLLKVLNMV